MSLDREIEDLLAVDPSPEFVAKVRQRIAEQPAPRAWLAWPLAAVAAGAVAVVAAAALWPFAPTSGPEIASASAAGAAPADKPTREAQIAPTGEAAVAPTRETRIAHARVSNHPGPAAVLIQREEAEAMNLLLTRVREDALPDMTEALAVVDATGPEWIAIPAVVIEPIASGEGE